MLYSEDLTVAIRIAQSLAREYRHGQFSPAHLLMAVLHNDTGIASQLAASGKDIHYLRDWAEVRLDDLPKTAAVTEAPAGDTKVKAVLEAADLTRLYLAREQTDAWCVLAALLKPGLAFSADQLKSLPLTHKEIIEGTVKEAELRAAVDPASAEKPAAGSGAIYKYCSDKTALAAEGKLDPVFGRDHELRTIVEILSRRTKPNVLITGEPGVGKTSLVNAMAHLIAQNRVPKFLREARIIELDTGALVAGASYKGEVEERLKSIIREIKQFEKPILFVDDLAALLDSKGSVGTGAVGLLKPELARGELTLMGTATNEAYRKYIERDEAFNRLFELVRVEEPGTQEAVQMIGHVLPHYEQHHGLTISAGAVEASVQLSRRYLRDRRLPDAALDLLDRSLAAVRMANETSGDEIRLLETQFSQMMSTRLAGTAGQPDAWKWFEERLKARISPVLLAQAEPDTSPEWRTPELAVQNIHLTLARLLELAGFSKSTVDEHDVTTVVAHKTGIPLGKIRSQEKDRLLRMEQVLSSRVIGQDHAVKTLSEAIMESRSGLQRGKQPIGSFFLLGPTGTGKTELAKALADFLFNDETFLIRFDMSEFKEEHSAALLYGAPPGYVGYEEGGLLVNRIRQKPYSVVLFDEIEKAHSSVFDIFLQILDEGLLHDRLGKEGDFSNAVILFTSNIGSEYVAGQFAKKQIPTASQLMEIMSRHFRPEFLARLTEIVPFAPISEEVVVSIFNLHLKGLTEPLGQQGITLEITPEAQKHLALSGFSPAYGARPLKGVIRNQLRKPISRMMVRGELEKGSTLRVHLDEAGEIRWEVLAADKDRMVPAEAMKT
jgi:ATP-dependent Clp protease ATP-binding subunit ClpA